MRRQGKNKKIESKREFPDSIESPNGVPESGFNTFSFSFLSLVLWISKASTRQKYAFCLWGFQLGLL